MAKPCIITFRGQKYSYDEFATLLYSGLLTDLTDSGIVDTSGFKQGKPKKKYKDYHEMSEKEKLRADMLSFDQYRQEKFGRLNSEIAAEIKAVEAELENPLLTDEARDYLQSLLKHIESSKKDQLKDYYQYKEDVDTARRITEILSNPEVTEEERIDAINQLYTLDEIARRPYLNDAQVKLAKHFWDLQAAKLAENEKFIIEKAQKTDIKPWDVQMKVLSHMPEYVPELQQFSKVYDNAHFDMTEEAASKKNTFEKLGKAVIEETNKRLGIAHRAKTLFSSDSAKYFDYMDNGKGELLTLDEAKAKGLDKAQIEFLKYTRELIAERNGIVDEHYDMPFEVLKTDPSFAESFKAEGMLRAVGNFLGSSYNLRQVRIAFTDPNTGTESIDNFANIEKKIIQYGNKGPVQKAKAIVLLMKYNAKARKQLKSGVNVDEKENPLEVKGAGEYTLGYNGQLIGKFDRPRGKERGYSKDFYAAGLQFIDDMMHVKHMSKIVPIANSLEHMAKTGYNNVLTGEKIEAKQNTAKWIDEWRKMHLFKEANSKSPELDAALKFLRFFTSATTMMFNIPAAGWNAFMGNYNNWRSENSKKVGIGNKRLFGKGIVDKYSVDILKKYKVVSSDYDSNPKFNIGGAFSELGHLLTRLGEFQIQGSMFLGLMSEDEYNSFEYKKDKHGVEQLVVKEGVDESALKEKLLGYKNRVSDIQGKYAEKDRRNILNSELGKAVFQFKLWVNDWFRERYADEYIDLNGETKRGSWREFTGEAFAELRNQIKEEGPVAFFKNKNAMSNLKGLMFTTMFLILASNDDDDKKKKSRIAEEALGNLLFVFDPEQLKYTLKNPIASVGTVVKFIDASEALFKGDFEKAGKGAVKLTPANKIIKTYERLIGD